MSPVTPKNVPTKSVLELVMRFTMHNQAPIMDFLIPLLLVFHFFSFPQLLNESYKLKVSSPLELAQTQCSR